jgi:hypothetical protein
MMVDARRRVKRVSTMDTTFQLHRNPPSPPFSFSLQDHRGIITGESTVLLYFLYSIL